MVVNTASTRNVRPMDLEERAIVSTAARLVYAEVSRICDWELCPLSLRTDSEANRVLMVIIDAWLSEMTFVAFARWGAVTLESDTRH